MRNITSQKRILIIIIALLGVAAMWNIGLLNVARWQRGAANLVLFIGDLLPPDWSVTRTVVKALFETLQIAFVGTLLGFLIAVPLSLLATRTLYGRLTASFFRLVLAATRTIPTLLWAIIFVVAFGLGAAAGTLGITLYSIGYFGKVFYETFEGVNREVVEAVRGVGSSRWQLARFAVLPEAANSMLAQLLFLFEYNVRASAILGFVGAGGIGYYLLGYIHALQYRRMTTALVFTLGVVLLIDAASRRLRAKFLLEN